MKKTKSKGMTRREALELGVSTFAVSPMINRGRYRLFEGTSRAQEFSARAIRLVEEATVMDMLAPFSIVSHRTKKWLEDPATFTDEEIELTSRSGIDVWHDTTGSTLEADPFTSVLHWAAQWNGFIAHHSDWLMRITEPEHLDRINTSGKVGFLLGLQNSEHFRTVDDVNLFHSLGQRVSQLTYNSQNRIATGTMDRHDGGISDFGVDIVERMNEVGMAVDVSHCGDRTTLDAFEVSTKPVLITHSNVRALVPGYPRNKTDEAIRKMAEQGGVIGMTAVRSFVHDTEPTTIEHLLDHYDYVAKLVGVEHLGIGSDTGIRGGYDAYEGEEWAQIGGRYRDQYRFRDQIDMDEMPKPDRIYVLTEGLIRRGYSDDDIQLILGGNFKRVLKEIWSV